jgi:hypothetical protein
MSGTWSGRLAGAAALGLALVCAASARALMPQAWAGVLDEHPAIQYAIRPTTDRVWKLNQALTEGGRSLRREARTGYLLALLDALNVPQASQILVFSKTGVQRAWTSPQNPRALFFDESVVVGYIPGAPTIEIAAHDRQQGVVFYTLDQAAPAPVLTRRTNCLTCHVSASTLEVPGMLVRSHIAGDGGQMMPFGSQDVTHQTPHPDRWGGWFVTAEGAAPRYAQRAHAGNITFAAGGITSNEVFVNWINSSAETRGYVSRSSDITALLVFDHQMHAINLLTRLNWEARIASGSGGSPTGSSGQVRRLVNELADYMLFTDEAPITVPLTPPAEFAQRLEGRVPKDRHGRSFGQLDLTNRLLRYPCSYIVYSEAFDGLPAAVKEAVYRRIVDILSQRATPGADERLSAADRLAIFEILKDTKPDFPP